MSNLGAQILVLLCSENSLTDMVGATIFEMWNILSIQLTMLCFPVVLYVFNHHCISIIRKGHYHAEYMGLEPELWLPNRFFCRLPSTIVLEIKHYCIKNLDRCQNSIETMHSRSTYLSSIYRTLLTFSLGTEPYSGLITAYLNTMGIRFPITMLDPNRPKSSP